MNWRAAWQAIVDFIAAVWPKKEPQPNAPKPKPTDPLDPFGGAGS